LAQIGGARDSPPVHAEIRAVLANAAAQLAQSNERVTAFFHCEYSRSRRSSCIRGRQRLSSDQRSRSSS
jgi:hypothetical protein